MQDLQDTTSNTKAEEQALFKRLREDGDESARENIIKSNLRFVITVAKQYQNQGISLDDLIAEGNVGLLDAIDRFDTTKDLKFFSYAVWWIRYYITYAIARQSRIVALPMNKINNIVKINRHIERREQELGRAVKKGDIEETIKQDVPTITTDDFNVCYGARDRSISLDSTLSSQDEVHTLVDTMESEDIYYRTEDRILNKDVKTNLMELLETLHVIEKDILLWQFEMNNPFKCMNDILITYALSNKQYNFIYNRALEKLKKSGRSSLIKR